MVFSVILAPNAGGEPPPEAVARHERTLSAVGCSARRCQNPPLTVSSCVRQPLAVPGTLSSPSPSLCRGCPHDHTAKRPLSAEGSHQPRPLADSAPAAPSPPTAAHRPRAESAVRRDGAGTAACAPSPCRLTAQHRGCAAFQRTTLRGRQREVCLAPSAELRLEPLLEKVPRLEGLARCCERFGMAATAGPVRLLVGAAIELCEVGVDALVDRPDALVERALREGARVSVHCAHRAAVHRDTLRAEEVQLLAPPREGAADLPQGRTVVRAQGGNRRGGGPERLPQPPQVDIALRLLRQAATRPPAVAIAVTGALQALARGLAGSPGSRRHGTAEAACFELACVDQGIEEADGMIPGPGGVEALREAEHVVAVCPLARAPGSTRLRDRTEASVPTWQGSSTLAP